MVVPDVEVIPKFSVVFSGAKNIISPKREASTAVIRKKSERFIFHPFEVFTLNEVSVRLDLYSSGNGLKDIGIGQNNGLNDKK